MCFIPLRSAIAIAIATLGIVSLLGVPLIARAHERANAQPSATEELARTDPASTQGTAWGPIVAGCLGVLFGAAIAGWHVRGKRS